MKYHFSLCAQVTIVALLTLTVSNAFAIRPYSRYVSTPVQEGMAYDSLNIRTPDHYRLTGWYCRSAIDSSIVLIILAGGDAGNMSYDIPLAKFLSTNFHLPVLLFDYRGFGSSQGFNYDSSSIAEPQYLTDFDAVVSYATEHYPNRKIIIYGRSMGASLAIVEACKRTGFTGVIAESPYVSQKLLKEHFEDKRINGRTDTIRIISSEDLEPLARVMAFKPKNFLLLHGADEKFILSEEERTLIESIPAANKKFVDFPECDHLELPTKATQKFGDAMATFFATCDS